MHTTPGSKHLQPHWVLLVCYFGRELKINCNAVFIHPTYHLTGQTCHPYYSGCIWESKTLRVKWNPFLTWLQGRSRLLFPPTHWPLPFCVLRRLLPVSLSPTLSPSDAPAIFRRLPPCSYMLFHGPSSSPGALNRIWMLTTRLFGILKVFPCTPLVPPAFPASFPIESTPATLAFLLFPNDARLILASQTVIFSLSGTFAPNWLTARGYSS